MTTLTARLDQLGLTSTVDYIRRNQLPNGSIPWFENGKLDPWDHIEAAMGLSIGGDIDAAERAYEWLAKKQLDDGSWWANYCEDEPVDTHHRETNFVAYIATGVWHHFCVTKQHKFLTRFFPVVDAAIHFVLSHQAPTGEMYWAVNEKGESQRDALVTASSSIYKSIDCAIRIAHTLGHHRPQWQMAFTRLGIALRKHPEYFDRTWEPKTRFSMDWFYPVFTGALPHDMAIERLASRWNTFVEPQVGCRCVSDEPWVTIAESCELVLALTALGQRDAAKQLFTWLQPFKDADGGYWTGYNFRDNVIWPDEKTTWTAGAILLAADALYHLTPASYFFSGASPLLDIHTQPSLLLS